jgi:signal transduction histidine kinase
MQPTVYQHGLQFYNDDEYLTSAVVSSLIGEGLGDDRLLIVATAAHRRAFATGLEDAGLDVGALQTDGRLVFSDARSALADFMIDGRPDRARFTAVFSRVVLELSGPNRATVRVYGEMADLLHRDGNPEAAHELESFANKLFAFLPITIICGYGLDMLDAGHSGADLLRICDSHDHVAPAESYTLEVDLRDAVESAVDAARPTIDAAGQKLTMSVAGEPVVVEGDLGWLTQIASRLVDNASRYTGRGGHIAVEVESDLEAGEAWVAVSDTGVGMPAELLSRVFEHDGRGVGLALARQLVELHGGRIEATSGGVGRGSRVIFRLPLQTNAP